MAFWGCSFVFDGVPCGEHDLMLYDSFAGNSQDEGKFANTVSVLEDKVSTRWKPYFYGTTLENKLSFPIIFGVNQSRLDKGDYLDRYELESISSWLLGHNEYKWLEIIQKDLENVRYKCVITGLEIIEFGVVPWALKATVECDSPYAYSYPITFECVINGSKEITLYNESSHRGYYKPLLEIELGDSRDFSVTNLSDDSRVTKFSGVPSGTQKISVDNDCCIVVFDDSGLNPYPYFNFNFLRLIRGGNRLLFEGDCKVKITCEFPISVGS